MQYLVTIKTGNQRDAGIRCNVTIKLIGAKGESKKPHKLDHAFHKDFKQGACDQYTIEDDDIGNIECISLLVKPTVIDLTADWYIDYIIITKDPKIFGESVTFPFYQWLNKRDYDNPIIIATNKTCIPQKESMARMQEGRRTQQTKKSFLSWKKLEPGFPYILEEGDGAHDKLPDMNLRFTDVKSQDFERDLKKVVNNGKWLGVLAKFKSFSSFDDYKRFSRDLKNRPSWIMDDKWRSDEEFGREILNGLNPGYVRRCKILPNNFPVTDEHLVGLLNRNKTLEEEMDAGNIYIINHVCLQGIPTGTFNKSKFMQNVSGNYIRKKETKKTEDIEDSNTEETVETKTIQLAVPMCLFYVREDEAFVPVAIQLGQESENFPIWTPKDEPLDWLFAKMWFKNADFQVHQTISHFAYCHVILEPFQLAMYRHLPPVHPVYKLLREHLQFIIAINTLGRALLMNPVKNKHN